MACAFVITAPPGNRTLLTFDSFYTAPSPSDSLAIYDGPNAQGASLGVYSGQALPPAIESSGTSLYVVWLSSYNFLYASYGWSARIKFTSKPLQMCSELATVTTAPTTITERGGAYLANTNCSWNITAPDGQRVRINFTSFNTQRNGDNVFVYDGPNESSTLLAVVSGSLASLVLESSTPSMFVRFATNGDSVVLSGWSADITFLTTTYSKCTPLAVITANGTAIAEGSGVYGLNESCAWLIRAPEGQHAVLTFSMFRTEANFDVVTIYDGDSASAPIFGRFSGFALPPVHVSTNNTLYVTWSSDASVISDGWDAMVTFTSDFYVCPPLTTVVNNGTLIRERTGAYSGRLYCAWSITAPVGQRVLFTFLSLDTIRGDWLTFYNGNSSTSPMIANVTGSGAASSLPVFETASNAMYIVFSSNSDGSVADGMEGVVTFTSAAFYSCAGLSVVTTNNSFITERSGLYLPGMSCQWRVSAPTGLHVLLTFLTFATVVTDFVKYVFCCVVLCCVVLCCVVLCVLCVLCVYGMCLYFACLYVCGCVV